jgi:transcription termination factor Rho
MTRHQELLFSDEEMQSVWQVRRALNVMETTDATETLLTGLRRTKTNQEFLAMAQDSFKRR